MAPDRRSDREAADVAGFTLLEVIVALAIAALALVVLFRAGGGGLSAVDTAARVEEAVARAQSHLAAFGRAGSIRPGESTGDDGDGYRWRLWTRPIAERAAPEEQSEGGTLTGLRPSQLPLVLYDVEVTISWRSAGRNRSIAIATRRLGAAPASE